MAQSDLSRESAEDWRERCRRGRPQSGTGDSGGSVNVVPDYRSAPKCTLAGILGLRGRSLEMRNEFYSI